MTETVFKFTSFLLDLVKRIKTSLFIAVAFKETPPTRTPIFTYINIEGNLSFEY